MWTSSHEVGSLVRICLIFRAPRFSILPDEIGELVSLRQLEMFFIWAVHTTRETKLSFNNVPLKKLSYALNQWLCWKCWIYPRPVSCACQIPSLKLKSLEILIQDEVYSITECSGIKTICRYQWTLNQYHFDTVFASPEDLNINRLWSLTSIHLQGIFNTRELCSTLIDSIWNTSLRTQWLNFSLRSYLVLRCYNF